MEKRVEGLVRQFRDARRHRLRFEALVTALSVLVTGGVFWQLRKYGTALGESAPETAQPGAGGTVVETDADPPEETTRSGIAESPEDWEAGLPEFTDETTQQRIAAIAVSQLGYTEGGEIQLSDVGTSRTGYTRYGAWYGNPYGEWNTMFTYFCMYYAGVEKTEIPYGSGCWAWYETLSGKDMIAPCGNEQIGDILFFDTDSDGEPDRTGIVSGTGETEDGVLLSVIEGNCEGAVAEVQYLRGGSDMLGVLSADAYAVAEASLPPEVVLIDYSADSESGIHVDAQAAEGVFPEGTVMKAVDVAEDEAVQAAQDTLGENAAIRDAVAVDISFCTADGEEIEPADGNAVSVRISLPAEKQLSGDVYTLVHVDDDGEGELVADAQVASDGAAFIAESFSVYVITTIRSAGDPVLADVNDATHYYFYEDTAFGGNSATQPYIIYVGDSIEIASDNKMQWWYNWNTEQNGWKLEPDPSRSNVLETVKDSNGVDHNVYVTRFTALYPGNVEINDGTSRYFEVHEPIMVKSAHGYKQRDRIREHLFDWQINKDGYIPNRKEYPYYLTYDSQSPNNNADEKVTFYTKSYNSNESFRFYNQYGTEIHPSGAVVSSPVGPDADGKYTYTVELTATAGDLANDGYIRAVFSENNEEFWVRVWRQRDPMESDDGPGQELTHADMEIADGGSYTVSKTYFIGDTCYVDIMYYQADVTKVNDAFVYLYDGWYIDYAYPYGDENRKLREFKDETKHFSTADGDYEKSGTEGSTQYEYTSAWIANNEFNQRRAKHYDATQAEKAIFDVNLYLTPNKKMTYKVVDGNLVLQPDSTVENWDGDGATEEDLKREHVVFKLDHQDVIDARNKCPMHNGLDFTAKAEYTVLQLPIYKSMVNGEIGDGQFVYDIIDLNDTPLFSTQDQVVYSGLHHENNIAMPDVSEGAQIFHQYKAFEVFNANGNDWGAGVNGADLLNELQHAYTETDQPFANCGSAADVFAIVNSSSTDSEVKDLFNETAVKHRTGVVANPSADGEHFANITNGFYVIVDDAKIGETATVVPDSNDPTHGAALFQNMRLVVDSVTGLADYYFAIHEREPVDRQGVNFDQSYSYFKVHVEKVIIPETNEEFLVARVNFLQDNGSGDPKTMSVAENQRDLTFTNAKIMLPETGGTGTLPYMAGGIILISAAFLLPLIRRRKEDECDS